MHGYIVILVALAKGGNIQAVIGGFQGKTDHVGGQAKQGSLLPVDNDLDGGGSFTVIIAHIHDVGYFGYSFLNLFGQFAEHDQLIAGDLDIDRRTGCRPFFGCGNGYLGARDIG